MNNAEQQFLNELDKGSGGPTMRKTTLRKQTSEKATFIAFFPAIKGRKLFPARVFARISVNFLALPHNSRTEHDWESGTLTAETIDAGYISIILEI
jgi:hypothetical protein